MAVSAQRSAFQSTREVQTTNQKLAFDMEARVLPAMGSCGFGFVAGQLSGDLHQRHWQHHMDVGYWRCSEDILKKLCTLYCPKERMSNLLNPRCGK